MSRSSRQRRRSRARHAVDEHYRRYPYGDPLDDDDIHSRHPLAAGVGYGIGEALAARHANRVFGCLWTLIKLALVGLVLIGVLLFLIWKQDNDIHNVDMPDQGFPALRAGSSVPSLVGE